MGRLKITDQDWNDPRWVPECLAEALAAKAAGRAPSERARPYFHSASFQSLAHSCAILGGRDHHRMPGPRIVLEELALHSSDFPQLTAEAMRKILLPAYMNHSTTFSKIASEYPLLDFRPHSLLSGDAFPNLLETPEHAEFKLGALADRAETITAANYGRRVNLTRALIVNDDLGQFARLATMAGQRAADFANQLLFARCINVGSGLGPDLSDGALVFDAAHSNVAGAGALDATRLGEARSLLRNQITSDGLRLNTRARYLLVSPDHETAAEQLLDGLHGDPLEVLADSNLTGTRFYVLADPAQLSNYVYGYVIGRGPEVMSRVGFDVDGIEVRVTLSMGVGAVDSLGAVTGAGA